MIEYKNIIGYPNYRIGNDGTIWTCKLKGGNDRSAGKIGDWKQLRQCRNKDGYMKVGLDCNGKNKSFLVHRLVLESFVGPCPIGLEACHYPDGNKSNNNISNLRWDTRIENVRDKTRDVVLGNTKLCNRCGLEKLRAEFYRNKRSSDGICGECKRCHCDVSMLTCNKDKKRERNRIWMRNYRK